MKTLNPDTPWDVVLRKYDIRGVYLSPGGMKFVPAHSLIFSSFPNEIKAHMRLQYLHSGVSCIRPKAGKLRDLIEALGVNSQAFELEGMLRGIVGSLCQIPDSRVIVSWDSTRDNGGVPGLFIYLGTSNAPLFLKRMRMYREAVHKEAIRNGQG